MAKYFNLMKSHQLALVRGDTTQWKLVICTYSSFENKNTEISQKIRKLCRKVFVICIASVITLVHQKYRITQS